MKKSKAKFQDEASIEEEGGKMSVRTKEDDESRSVVRNKCEAKPM